jgi:pyridoxamine 5'-phosphate oxidase
LVAIATWWNGIRASYRPPESGAAVVARTYAEPVAAGERELREVDVSAEPFTQFASWYEDAVAQGTLQPDAMIVATVARDGRPSARAVLLRGVDERGFCFYTNFESRKGREIADNPRAAIVFHWPEALRQVRVTGRVEQVTHEESDAYWRNRPEPSRVSAWASRQSEPIASRAALEAQRDEVVEQFADADIPLPPFWGGYRVVPDEIEFWQHRDDRLHDRVVYERGEGVAGWRIQRLQP